jgi:predicted HicB family RNase H-like nuclease
MQLSGYVQAIDEDLARVAAIGDEQTGRAAELLAGVLESSISRHMQEALAEAALEVSTQLDDGRVEVRVAGSDLELVYVADAAPSAEAPDEAFAARLTLRLPQSLKSRLEAAAAGAGVSVNTWLVQTIIRALEPRPSGGSRHRLTGYGRS